MNYEECVLIGIERGMEKVAGLQDVVDIYKRESEELGSKGRSLGRKAGIGALISAGVAGAGALAARSGSGGIGAAVAALGLTGLIGSSVAGMIASDYKDSAMDREVANSLLGKKLLSPELSEYASYSPDVKHLVMNALRHGAPREAEEIRRAYNSLQEGPRSAEHYALEGRNRMLSDPESRIRAQYLGNEMRRNMRYDRDGGRQIDRVRVVV